MDEKTGTPTAPTPTAPTQAGPTQAGPTQAAPKAPALSKEIALPKEIGGAKGPEPTRYGDWEHKGRCTDF